MKTIIAGSRDITDFETVENAVRMSGFKVSEVVSGAAKGVDRIGAVWASLNNVEVTQFPADWENFGKSAGYRRNCDMAKYVGNKGALIAVWDGKSKGTNHMIDIANRYGLKIYIYNTFKEN